MANYFLGSVGRAEAFRTVGKKLELAFVSKTLTDSNVNISTSVDDIRAGQGAPVVARFAHDANVEITLTDVMFKNAYVESQLGTRFVKGGDAFKTETLTASSGKLTLSGEPKELNNSCFESGFKGVWATQYDDVITAVIKKDGVQVSQTLIFSVYTYIQKNQGTSDEKLCELLKAIYNYGESAKLYEQ